MVDVPNSRFCDNIKYPTQQSIQTGKQTTSSCVECNQDGNSNRSSDARLCESVNTHRKYRADIPGGSGTRGRCDPDSVHPGNRRSCVLDLRIDHRNDRRPDAQRVQVKNKTKPAGGFIARFLLLAIFLSVVVFPFASAVTYISFSPMGLETEDLYIYNSTGGLFGNFNTSSPAIPLVDNQSYNILVVPSSQNLMGNHPELWFELAVTKLRENSIGLMVAFFIVAILIAAYRRG